MQGVLVKYRALIPRKYISISLGITGLTLAFILATRTKKGQRMLASFLPSTFFSNPYAHLDPTAATIKFRRDFELQYGTSHPAFAEESYNSLLQKCKNEYKFVVIYLHSDMHDDTKQFCNELLATETVEDLLNDHFLVWANDIRAPEGHKLSLALEATSFPYMAVLTNNKAGGISKLDSWEGLITPDELLNRLTNILEKYGHILTEARIANESRDFDRRLRDEQMIAYEESIRRDTERQEKEDRDRQNEEMARIQREREERDMEDRQRDRERRRSELARTIAPEPSADDRRAVRIAVRLPDGSRLQRRFAPESQLQAVYDFVDSQKELKEYDLVASHPRQVYANRDQTLTQAGLQGQSLLSVEEH